MVISLRSGEERSSAKDRECTCLLMRVFAVAVIGATNRTNEATWLRRNEDVEDGIGVDNEGPEAPASLLLLPLLLLVEDLGKGATARKSCRFRSGMRLGSSGGMCGWREMVAAAAPDHNETGGGAWKADGLEGSGYGIGTAPIGRLSFV